MLKKQIHICMMENRKKRLLLFMVVISVDMREMSPLINIHKHRRLLKGLIYLVMVVRREFLTVRAMSANGWMETSEALAAASSLTWYSIVDLMMLETWVFSMISKRTR